MKECPRCKITFHLDDRLRCLYCDTLLRTVDEDQTDLQHKMEAGLLGTGAQPVVNQVAQERGIQAQTRLQFIVSSYFRTRTFHFMYAFSRNDFKRGPTFKRELIQPFHVTSLLALPWLALNIVDSFVCRFLYTHYCPRCGWKFFRADVKGEHVREECDYNREYEKVVDAVLSGEIIREEEQFKRLGLMKKNARLRSAYWDLSAHTDFFSSILDLVCIWFSVCLWILLLVALTFPSIIDGVYRLDL
ncbi:MAG TPA: hypothetical protein VLJ10_04980 [Candidatus Bathyarchaeia archaeon]|nr:hypothetical protein [Candidatus Bathyarchaeia archaeon]